MEEKKVGVQITASAELDDDEVTSPEADVVKGKLEHHHIKQLSTLLKPYALANVDALLKKHLRPANFLEGDVYEVTLAPLVLHGGLWRWMPDFALKSAPMETGRLHMGVMLGPYVVDWTDSHLVAIRTLASCEPLVLVKLAEQRLYSGASLDEATAVLRKAATVIVDWNVKKKFDWKKGSPMVFVDQLMSAVSAQVSVPARIRDTIVDAQKKGGEKFEAVFQADWAVMPGDKKAKKQKFKTHADLDEWVLGRRIEHPDLETQHPDDWAYLKLLDRVFWCGKEQADSEWSARDRPRANGCAFGPPAFEKVMELEIGTGPKKSQLIQKKKV